MSRIDGTGSAVDMLKPAQHVPERPSTRPKSHRAPQWLRPTLVVACVLVVAAGLLAVGEAGRASHTTQVGAITKVLAAVSLTATATYLALMIALHLLPTGYSPIGHAVATTGSVATAGCSLWRSG